ncbi:MAG: ABC transporter permease subunit [Bacilli bacterium]|jgi:ABC-type polysaccharide transport system permease subunit|nr:ABC transporter permease subunit [Bacilli bacterium]
MNNSASVVNGQAKPQKRIIKALPKKSRRELWKRDIRKNWPMYLIFLPIAAYFIIFCYVPMVGIVIAFERYSPTKGILRSPWVGWENFADLFNGDTFGLVMRNTIFMALLNLTIGFLAPVVFAILLSQVKVKWFKRVTQICSYMPNFIAAVVVSQLVIESLGSNGAITIFFSWFGAPADKNWLADTTIPVFWLINTFIGVWQGLGMGAIVYSAAIASVNPNLHEAAAIDGANRWKRLWHVTVPSITPLVVSMWTLSIGTVFLVGFDKILLLYKPITYDVADCLATYTYRYAFGTSTNYGLSSASGLFQSVVGTFLLIVSNYLNRKFTNWSLF